VIIEQYLEDSQYENACKTMLEIADDLETVVELIKSNREMTSVPDIASEIKNINEFADSVSVLIRGRSWASICHAFDPKESLDTIKTLKGIMKRPKKRTRTRRVPDGPVPDGPVPDGPVQGNQEKGRRSESSNSTSDKRYKRQASEPQKLFLINLHEKRLF